MDLVCDCLRRRCEPFLYIWPTGSRFPYTYIDLNLEEGRQMHFRRVSKGSGYADAVFRHEETSSEFYRSTHCVEWRRMDP